MALATDLVGTESDPHQFTWTHDDVMLYALSVGAGQDDPPAELAFTTENTDGVVPAVLPTFANIITRGAQVDFGDYDRARLVHAEQSFRAHGTLPVAGTAVTTARVAAVYDKGRGALVRTEATATDATTGTPLATTVQTVYIAGEGGFGGPRGESVPSPIPERAPDERIRVMTRPEQALLYRLTGDRNPLHTDPAFAARGGFDRPILHGMCTYGFAGRVLLHAVCAGDPGRLLEMDARFTRPVLPGDALTVEVWKDPHGAHFRVVRDGDVVLDRGRVDVRR